METINPFLAKITAALENHRQTEPITNTTCSSLLKECGLDNVDCKICGNTGYIFWNDENFVSHSKECSCMPRRRSIRRLEDSGLKKMVQRYSFDNYQTPTEKHMRIKAKAMEFVNTPAEFFFISGKPGTGKTHICTAICSWLIDADWEVRYMLWRTEAAELKAMINDREEYKKAVNKLRNAAVLYIDDFFKGTVSDADINLAFTILNDRYNTEGKKTIISSELSLKEISGYDDAVGGRIAERSRGYACGSPELNWRYRNDN